MNVVLVLAGLAVLEAVVARYGAVSRSQAALAWVICAASAVAALAVLAAHVL